MKEINLQLFAQEPPVAEGASTGLPQEKGTVEAQQPSSKVAATPTLEERLAKLEALVEERQSTPKASTYTADLKAQAAQRRMARARELLARLRQQEQEAREIYPKLNLRQELKDPRFADLIRSGVDVRSAFEVVHKDQIISASMEYAAREVERMMTNKLLAEGSRPRENGGNGGPSVSRVDVKSMSRQERKDIARRVRMGEKIAF
jgi:hypothetical protein